MIIDLTLIENTYVLKIHKKLFQNVSCPLESFQKENYLMKKYAYLGFFHINGDLFGFDGCFKKDKEADEYISYIFVFPEIKDALMMRKMISTIYLVTYYVVEQMYYAKEFFNETIWNEQSLSFVIFDGDRRSYAIGGQLYPWFKGRLNSLNKEELSELNEYVGFELNRVSNYFYQRDICYGQINITQQSFFIQVNMNGRWIYWNNSRDLDKQDEFSSHNIDFSSDQELCFSAVVAMNTWLRKH